MEQIDNVTRWAESGLLNGVDDPQNAKDLADIPDKVKKAVEVVPVNTIEEVLAHALVRIPESIQKDGDKIADLSPETAENKAEATIRH